MKPDLAQVLLRVLESPNESDSNGETANIVDVVAHLARAIDRLAKAMDRPNSLNQRLEAVEEEARRQGLLK